MRQELERSILSTIVSTFTNHFEARDATLSAAIKAANSLLTRQFVALWLLAVFITILVVHRRGAVRGGRWL